MLRLCKRFEILEHGDDIHSLSLVSLYTITESYARFLLSLLEDISIDFPSHFILSLIDVFRDTTTCDKLIFPSAITRLLRHFSISYPESTHFSIMCAIKATTIRRSEAQLQPRRPQIEIVVPLASFAPSTSAPLSSAGGVTLEAIMAQLVRMDAYLDTFSDELCPVNTRVGCIARRQAAMGGFTTYTSPSPLALKDESDDGSGNDDADEDNGASSASDDEMST